MPTSPIMSVKWIPQVDGQHEMHFTMLDGTTSVSVDPLLTLALSLDAVEWTALQEAIKNPYTGVMVK